jgi:vacuolar-type H+-ATPase subunit C/Vma6
MLILRFIHTPGERQPLKARLGDDGLQNLFPGFGTLSSDLLTRAAAVKNIRMAVDLLGRTSYSTALQSGLMEFEHSGLLSDLERALRRYQLHWNAAQIVKNPLGIGVVIGYLALKTNEIRNIRRAARGIQMKWSPNAIQAEMELVG